MANGPSPNEVLPQISSFHVQQWCIFDIPVCCSESLVYNDRMSFSSEHSEQIEFTSKSMRFVFRLSLTTLLLFTRCFNSALADEVASGAPLQFCLPTLDGESIVVEAEPAISVTVVCFLGAECPLVKLYSPRLSSMSREYADQGVRFVAVNSNRQDTVDDIRGYLNEHPLPFPLVRDEGNVVADQFGATRTPEVFVLDKSLNHVYHGRIDDQYEPGVNRPAANHHELRTAIEKTLAGESVDVASTEPVGCMIGKVRKPVASMVSNDISYCNQVSRVLQKHCV